MNIFLLEGLTEGLMIGDNCKRNGRQQKNSKLLEGKNYGQSFSFACTVHLLGARLRSAGELQRSNFSVSRSFSEEVSQRYRRSIGSGNERSVKVREAQNRGVVSSSFRDQNALFISAVHSSGAFPDVAASRTEETLASSLIKLR